MIWTRVSKIFPAFGWTQSYHHSYNILVKFYKRFQFFSCNKLSALKKKEKKENFISLLKLPENSARCCLDFFFFCPLRKMIFKMQTGFFLDSSGIYCAKICPNSRTITCWKFSLVAYCLLTVLLIEENKSWSTN